MLAPPVISLLTDFGCQDSYVGQVRGVIAGIAPSATIIDLTHAIPPQDILCGAITWADAVAAFPPGTIHVGVVDPGVGTARRAIAAEIGHWRFVAPDNGLLTAVQACYPTHAVVELNRAEWHRVPKSSTFHGRDLFAPVAAHWAQGVPVSELGSPLATPPVALSLPTVTRTANEVCGRILWPDRFGNLLTNITTGDLPSDVPASQFRVLVAGRVCEGIAHCYGDHPLGTLLALWGSSERLEIAINGGSAAETLGLKRGDPIQITW